jgi:hypothetical protein
LPIFVREYDYEREGCHSDPSCTHRPHGTCNAQLAPSSYAHTVSRNVGARRAEASHQPILVRGPSLRPHPQSRLHHRVFGRADTIALHHIAEAINYRTMVRRLSGLGQGREEKKENGAEKEGLI